MFKASVDSRVKLLSIYQYDDFDGCRRLHSDFVYCVTKVHFDPDPDSLLWNYLQNYSTHPRRYDRRTIEMGTCVQECAAASAAYNITTVLEDCVSSKVWAQYEFNSSVETVKCISSTESTPQDATEIGILEVAFLCCAVGIVVLVGLSTVKDTAKPQSTSFFPVPSCLVKSFSLARTLPKLVNRNGRSESALYHLDGIRTIATMSILLAHSSIPLLKMPLKNVEQLESQLDHPLLPIVMAANTYTVQLFFILGGFLLAVSILERGDTETSVSFFFERVKNRLIRILPSYIFVIFFHASWYRHLFDGPIGHRFTDYCTSHWWTNLLFVNNYVHTEEPCIQFAWYLGADFQLYLVGTALMMLMLRFPKGARSIQICMVLSALLVPAITIYVFRLDATVMFILKYVLKEIRTLPYYTKVYLPLETNAGNYFFGVLGGICYHKYKDKPSGFARLKMNYLLLIVGTLFVTGNCLTMLLPEDHLDYPSILLAVFGSFLKSIWGLFLTIVLLYLALKRPPPVLAVALRHPMLLVGSKLSYCIYLVQYGLIYTIYRYVTEPLMYNGFTLLLFTSTIVSVTLTVAFLLHVCLELPCDTLLKPENPGSKRK
ncbi:regulator of hypoxia-inducible factor 1-like [Anopheles cruzii]|uniref:regulator of hypoxia-inducible factor 1-like n=1 Tax=Anopheles cruzii TaxID=68878 RepID=UPI0022EC1A71|nr:regulator of hypoxia-inducible factor 1-like [Anopheles cruzii]